MRAIEPKELIQQLNWRYATKQFDPEQRIPTQTWAALEESLVLTPSSYGLQPWKFIVVTDPARRAKLVEASWGQRQVADASHLVVFAIRKELREADVDDYVERIASVRGAPRDSLQGFRDMMVRNLIKDQPASAKETWARNQVYIALGNFLTSAALLGVDACPMEGIEPEKYDQLLGLDQQGLTTAVVAAAGYRATTDKYAELKKVRFPKDELVLTI